MATVESINNYWPLISSKEILTKAYTGMIQLKVIEILQLPDDLNNNNKILILRISTDQKLYIWKYYGYRYGFIGKSKISNEFSKMGHNFTEPLYNV